MNNFGKEEYKGKFGVRQSGVRPTTHRPRHPNDEFGALSQHKKIKNPELTTGDSYLSYINHGTEGEGDDPLEFWNSRIGSEPDLAHFALDMLAIPATSAECERIFSSAKLLLTPSRNRLQPDIIEASECLRAWYGKPGDREEKLEGQVESVNQSRQGSQSLEESLGEDWDGSEESDKEGIERSDGESDGESDEESDEEEIEE